MKKQEIDARPSSYGSKGQQWAAPFIDYMVFIVTHPAYRGMPDAIKEDGKIQWEAPSNRNSGQYQYTHVRRRDWWKKKAEEIGIDTSEDQWISKTAKSIHPTKEKPCKRCGRIMKISYVYPNAILQRRIRKEFPDLPNGPPYEDIYSIVNRVFDLYKSTSYVKLQRLFSTASTRSPLMNTRDELIAWLDFTYIPSEPPTLSPGAMSNAPDRLDGFHSFNLCCRGKADTGRDSANLRSYTTDRRVFEFWSDGDWIAADRLMGLVRTTLSSETCADGGKGPPTADHIGPLSLGFCHIPVFRLLSREANSAKNNRMRYIDVEFLRGYESKGNAIVSWYAISLWSLAKERVSCDADALHISKIMRDNQRIAMDILALLLKQGCYLFLLYLLNLQFADYNIDFTNIRSVNFITTYDAIIRNRRMTKYSQEQKVRKIRIAIDSLKEYSEKENRHGYPIPWEVVQNIGIEVSESLKKHPIIVSFDAKYSDCLQNGKLNSIPLNEIETTEVSAICNEVKGLLIRRSTIWATLLVNQWDSDRYMRSFDDA